MKHTQTPCGYWNFERVSELALKCATKKEFKEEHYGAYRAAYRNRWIDLVFKHMTPLQKPNGYWTFERVSEVALKCGSKKEFKQRYSAAITVATTNGWIDLVCKHMTPLRKPNGYWTLERVSEFALKCETRKEFRERYPAANTAGWLNKWMDKVCYHMS